MTGINKVYFNFTPTEENILVYLFWERLTFNCELKSNTPSMTFAFFDPNILKRECLSVTLYYYLSLQTIY